MVNNDKILFSRTNAVKDPNFDKKKNTGVLVIDPNKVVNDDNVIKDRYVKQEDLMIYASLKVYQKANNSIIVSENKQPQVAEFPPLYINFLNPLKSKSSAFGGNNFKNKFTSEWTDFFTSKEANANILDPETFGISDIDIKINADCLPSITIQFTDVQGRVLFDKGNENDNPYNIFFRYPYPKFLLKFKGYYGRTVEMPLVLLKSDTSFDPSSGNYTITAQFQSEIFATFNNFLMIYAYVAPYMFRMEDGSYLGKTILSKLYENQNNELKGFYGDVEYPNYSITSTPTMLDLSNALSKIPTTAVSSSSSNNQSILNNQKYLEIKARLDQYYQGINSYFNNVQKYVLDDGGYRATSSQYSITSSSEPVDFRELVKNYNTEFNALPSDEIKSGIKADIKRAFEKNNVLSGYLRDLDKGIANNSLFINGDFYDLEYFDEVMRIINTKIDELQQREEEEMILSQINDIGNYLGYKPNLSNIIRIICNNIQTFLILLEIVSQNALQQIKTNSKRRNKYKSNCDYFVDLKQNALYTPFPDYYKYKTLIANGENIQQIIKAFPGADSSNKDWFEVVFVDEIFEAIQRLKAEATNSESEVIKARVSGILTSLGLGEPVLDPYFEKKDVATILSESIAKYMLYVPYAGYYYRGIGDTAIDSISKIIGEFETGLMEATIFDKLPTSNAKFILADTIFKAIKPGDGTDSINTLAYTYIQVKNQDTFYPTLITKTIEEIKLYKTRYDATQFNTIIGGKSKYVQDNILDKNFYANIYTKTNALFYSMSNQKNESGNSLSVQPNLGYNANYYVGNIEPLKNISNAVRNVQTGKEENLFSGYLPKLNLKLKDTNINADFNATISYMGTKQPALTFNTTTNDAEYGDNFDTVSEGKRYSSKYQKLIF